VLEVPQDFTHLFPALTRQAVTFQWLWGDLGIFEGAVARDYLSIISKVIV